MDSESKKAFQEILGLDPESLSEEQIKILRARRSYLTKEQARIFASVLTVNKGEGAKSPTQAPPLAPEVPQQDPPATDEQTESVEENQDETESTETADPDDEYSGMDDADPDAE